MESSIIRTNRPSAGRTSLSYNNATAIPTTKFTAGPSATGAGKTALSKASLFVDTPTPSPPASRVSGAIGASKLGFASRFSPYEAKRALLTPTGAGGFNILRPIETCIDRLSPTPTRFPRKLYGSRHGTFAIIFLFVNVCLYVHIFESMSVGLF